MLRNQPVFEYEYEWADYFEDILKNEIREEAGIKNAIKASIIESNQSIQELCNRHEHLELVPSKEPSFHNLRIRDPSQPQDIYLYVNTQNERLWIIHNVEYKQKIAALIGNIVSNSYLQDRIYLSHGTMEQYREEFKSDSLGFTLSFDQLFTDDRDHQVFAEELPEFQDVNFTLQLWLKRRKSLDFFLHRFKQIQCPVNYRMLNFVFEDEANEVLIKEDLFYDGSFTIHRGRDLQRHLRFVFQIRDRYSDQLLDIEDKRIDLANFTGDRFQFHFEKTINPKAFIFLINKNSSQFKINVFKMYRESNSYMYNCVDLHTGGQFFLQVFPNQIWVYLGKGECGNILLRLYTNLQRYFTPEIEVEFSNTPYPL